MTRVEAIQLLEETLGRGLTPAELGAVDQTYSFNPAIELTPQAVLNLLEGTKAIPPEQAAGAEGFVLMPEEILIAQVEQAVGRPLTTLELGLFRDHLELRTFDILEDGGARREDDKLIPVAAELYGVVIGKILPGQQLPVPPEGGPIATDVQVAAGEDVDPAFLEGIPESLVDDLTGQGDQMGRPGIGNINGVEMVWDPTLGITAGFWDTSGPLPIGAAALGITQAGQSIVTNLFEVEQFIQKFQEDQQAIADLYEGQPQPVPGSLIGRINSGFYGGEGETPDFIPPGRQTPRRSTRGRFGRAGRCSTSPAPGASGTAWRSRARTSSWCPG